MKHLCRISSESHYGDPVISDNMSHTVFQQPYLLSSSHPIHHWHVTIHKHKLIVLIIKTMAIVDFSKSFIDFIDGFLPVDGLVRFQVVLQLEDSLQSHQVEYVIVHNQDLTLGRAFAMGRLLH